MSAQTVPDSITRLFESLSPPCHFEEIETRTDTRLAGNFVVKRTPCGEPAKWIVRVTYECGLTLSIESCDHHHDLVCVEHPALICPRHIRSEPVHDVISDAL